MSRTVVENVLTSAGFTTGITLGVFLLGLFAPRTSQRGARGFPDPLGLSGSE